MKILCPGVRKDTDGVSADLGDGLRRKSVCHEHAPFAHKRGNLSWHGGTDPARLSFSQRRAVS